MQIKGIESLSVDEINYELQRGGKFVVYQYCISIIVMTFKRSSKVYFISDGENAVIKGLIYTLISFTFGWWGLPWGPIYTIGSIVTNCKGGRDVSDEILSSSGQY